MTSTFKTNPLQLEALLKDCASGAVQLPDFQRSWVWDDDRIRSLIASISRAFPVGALMTLETGGAVDFKPRTIEGVAVGADAKPAHLLLDGQQRMTSLYQTTMRKEVVETVTARQVKVKRWYYIDMRKALDPEAEREDAVVGVPEDRMIKSNFGKTVELDLSTPELEYEHMMYPVNRVFDWDDWQDNFRDHWDAREKAAADEAKAAFRNFKNNVLQNFKQYQVPVISLDKGTSKEAVCLVFEKVNTGGKPLDAFELVTAMYAADGFELRRDWFGKGAEPGRYRRMRENKVLEGVSNTDFLQSVSLVFTRARRLAAEQAGRQGKELPAVSANRAALLNLPLDGYTAHADRIEDGYRRAAKLLYEWKVYRAFDLPYQSQLIPFAAILADIGQAWEHASVRQRLAQWFWCGVFGELYGSTVDTRFARDIMEVPGWAKGQGDEPTTVRDAAFRSDRLRSMRSRLSAAYKGVNALLMKRGAKDFRSGSDFDTAVFFNENVDIHHIFPRDWCEKQKIAPAIYDAIVNKTPLTARTNRIVGGVAPSVYLGRLEAGNADAPPIAPAAIDTYLATHLIDPVLLRADGFMAFYEARQEALLRLIEQAMGRAAYRGEAANEPETEMEPEPETALAAAE